MADPKPKDMVPEIKRPIKPWTKAQINAMALLGPDDAPAALASASEQVQALNTAEPHDAPDGASQE